MQMDFGTQQDRARQTRTLLAPLVAGALLVTSVLAVRSEGPPALNQQSDQSLESPASRAVGSSPDLAPALEPALRTLDGVVYHG